MCSQIYNVVSVDNCELMHGLHRAHMNLLYALTTALRHGMHLATEYLVPVPKKGKCDEFALCTYNCA